MKLKLMIVIKELVRRNGYETVSTMTTNFGPLVNMYSILIVLEEVFVVSNGSAAVPVQHCISRPAQPSKLTPAKKPML